MTTAWTRINTVLLLLVLFTLLALIGLVATRAEGGPLDPPASPSSTMKTLEEIPGTWSRKLATDNGSTGPNPPAGCNSSRFQCVLGNEAVLDLETGLVWPRSASSQIAGWHAATGLCYDTAVSDRLGSRLPTIEELASLVDYNASDPALPPGHPFINVSADFYWTATTYAGGAEYAQTIDFVDPFGYALGITQKNQTGRVWCVRGGHGYDGRQ